MAHPGSTRSELITDWRLLAFGTLASLASAPGQTLVISLFNADMRAAFDLGHGGFGTLYMLATLASAAVILWSGKLIDRFDLRTVFAVTTLGLCAACLVAGSATGPLGLLLALFMLRHFRPGPDEPHRRHLGEPLLPERARQGVGHRQPGFHHRRGHLADHHLCADPGHRLAMVVVCAWCGCSRVLCCLCCWC
jgi:MFS family permease